MWGTLRSSNGFRTPDAAHIPIHDIATATRQAPELVILAYEQMISASCDADLSLRRIG
jgi:hypothetical protein